MMICYFYLCENWHTSMTKCTLDINDRNLWQNIPMITLQTLSALLTKSNRDMVNHTIGLSKGDLSRVWRNSKFSHFTNHPLNCLFILRGNCHFRTCGHNSVQYSVHTPMVHICGCIEAFIDRVWVSHFEGAAPLSFHVCTPDKLCPKLETKLVNQGEICL